MNSRITTSGLAIAVAFTLVACASVEDFQAMSPEERAEKTCTSADAYDDRARDIRRNDSAMRSQTALLSTGYRVHENCQMVSTTIPGTTADCGGATGVSLQACKLGNTPATTQQKKVCTETPIPINHEYEARVLRNLQMDHESLSEEHQQKTYLCMAKVRSLPAERAYTLYVKGKEPS